MSSLKFHRTATVVMDLQGNSVSSTGSHLFHYCVLSSHCYTPTHNLNHTIFACCRTGFCVRGHYSVGSFTWGLGSCLEVPPCLLNHSPQSSLSVIIALILQVRRVEKETYRKKVQVRKDGWSGFLSSKIN